VNENIEPDGGLVRIWSDGGCLPPRVNAAVGRPRLRAPRRGRFFDIRMGNRAGVVPFDRQAGRAVKLVGYEAA
jgi:hypothetical protein